MAFPYGAPSSSPNSSTTVPWKTRCLAELIIEPSFGAGSGHEGGTQGSTHVLVECLDALDDEGTPIAPKGTCVGQRRRTQRVEYAHIDEHLSASFDNDGDADSQPRAEFTHDDEQHAF